LLHRLLPGECEVAGLLALMLLTDARRAARAGADGSIVPLDEQRRDLWDTAAIAEGQAILTRTLGTGPIGPYQLQAAIAALHDEAPTAEDTDWPQILALYDVLTHVTPSPIATLSRAVALAKVHGPQPGSRYSARSTTTTGWDTTTRRPNRLTSRRTPAGRVLLVLALWTGMPLTALRL
jgi:predicted RNA polymerase sigma factor